MQDSIVESKTIYYTLFMVFYWCGNIFIEERGKKQDFKSYLDSKFTIFEVINSFRLYDKVCNMSALKISSTRTQNTVTSKTNLM
jgi:hypothetical protein